MPSSVVCELCNKTFSKTFCLKRHYKNVHSRPNYVLPKELETPSPFIKCSMCTFTCCKFYEYSNHLLSSHEIELQTEELIFPDENEFMLWKTTMEDQDNSFFVKTRGNKHTKDRKTITYECNRSGYYKNKVESPSKRKRLLKVQGTSKINACCPSRIKVIVEKDKVTAKLCKTHVGHSMDMKHLPILPEDKKELASKIAKQIPFDVILDEVGSSVTNVLKRKHLLTKQDLRNIVREYSLESECIRNADDALSVEAWVEKEKLSQESSVILYKPNGVALSEYLDLDKNDFLLGIMTVSQAEMLKKYGNDIICIDSTHGTNANAYSFEMTTLLVLDSMHQVFPCAFFFSNRNDHTSLEIFLQAVKDKVGPVSAKTMMTDMADVFHNAWSNIMGNVQRRLYCTWHVQRAWQNKLNKTVKDDSKRKEALKKLYTLSNEVNQNNFEHILPVIVKEFCEDPNTEEFGSYFNDNYVKNCRAWAYCYRKNAGINTNMHLERLHGIFEHLYLKGKMAKRLDITIHALMRFVKRKLFDHLVILHKGKVTNKVRNIRDRHKKSLQLNIDNVLPSSTSNKNNTWTVFSSAATFDVYTVSFNDIKCTCSLVCQLCKACIHKFNCTCIDSCIKWNMCKHIHLVCRQLKAKEDENPAQQSSVDVWVDHTRPDEDHKLIEDEEKAMVFKAVGTGYAKDSDYIKLLKRDATRQYFEILRSAQTVKQMELVKSTLQSLQSKVILPVLTIIPDKFKTTTDKINTRK